MKIIAFNGSARKTWNTATLLSKALEGAAAQGASTELVHLYDVDFKGCVSCFACKTKGGKSYGRCAIKDGLAPLLKKAEEADAFIIGSPIYFASVTGVVRSLLERLCFPFMTYTDPPGSLYSGRVRTGFIYTLGATEELAKERGFDKHTASNEMLLKLIFGTSETLCSFDTYQFDDYSKVYAPRWDPEKKARRRSEVFPVDCQRAFEMGSRLAAG
ncbi:MAG: flavodoxin family protein [Syntrophorhabdales bacterium]